MDAAPHKYSPSTLTADMVFEAAERQGVVIQRAGWAKVEDDGRICACPMTAIAIDTEPLIKEQIKASYANEDIEDYVNESLIMTVTGLPGSFVDGVVYGFDHKSVGDYSSLDDEDYVHGVTLGQACLKRIRPDLFTSTEPK